MKLEKTTQEKDDQKSKAEKAKPATPKLKRGLKKPIKLALAIAAALLLIPLFYVTYIFFSSPAAIRNPQLEHYHFRMQVLVNGKAENFAASKYQQDYVKGQCSANLPKEPIHFHDNQDQLVHIHWAGMTGGMVMKYYGWDYIGGIDKALGYRLDNVFDIQKVSIHGNLLPAVPNDTSFYVYTGDENGYQEKSFNDWKTQDLEQFFGTASNFPAFSPKETGLSWIDKIFPKAHAHASESHNHESAHGKETSQEKLTRINNLIGNVVLFVQKDKPTNQQVQERFSDLEPLSESTCGG
ncbi:MAG TPA: hypothetical protein VD907_06095 [Verrucomicrobiae bacterium]|nr:hypothetical protein [Verrucomicrobiae bacterium]